MPEFELTQKTWFQIPGSYCGAALLPGHSTATSSMTEHVLDTYDVLDMYYLTFTMALWGVVGFFKHHLNEFK